MKNILYFLLGAATIVSVLMLTAYNSPTTPSKIGAKSVAANGIVLDSVYPPQQVRAPKIPKEVTFAGEALPNNFDALERFDRELLSVCFRHSNTFLLIKRANRYFPIIEPILKEEGLPDDFKYLAVAESSLSNAVSPAGARGFWQFMKATAIERKLEVNKEVDERYHLEKATRAACKYLKDARKDFDTWLLAAASYNVGKGKLRSRMKQQGGSKYFDLYLNQETSRYILRIMAIKEVLKDPKRHGFHLDEDDLYEPIPAYKEIKINGPIADLAAFAKKHNTTYRLLKIYNPWLRSTTLTNKYKKTYLIRVPSTTSTTE